MNENLKVFLGVLVGACGTVFVTTCACLVLGVSWISFAAAIVPDGYYQDPLESSCGAFRSGTGEGDLLTMDQSAEYDHFSVEVRDYEIEEGNRIVSEGHRLVWVEISVENQANFPQYGPTLEDFALVVDGFQMDPGYHESREGNASYWGGDIVPGAQKRGWIGFEVPQGISIEHPQFVLALTSTYSCRYFMWELSE